MDDGSDTIENYLSPVKSEMRVSGRCVAVPPVVTLVPRFLNGVLCYIHHVAPTVNMFVGIKLQKEKAWRTAYTWWLWATVCNAICNGSNAIGESSVTWHTSFRGRLGNKVQEEDIEPC